MVRLDRITTRGGDDGETSLGDGRRVPKTDPRIVALGAVDELNATIGVAIADGVGNAAEGLRAVQNDLFDLGAGIAVPKSDDNSESRLRIHDDRIGWLETWIEADNEWLEPLSSFVLPGGTPAAARLHVARAVCRRAEIAVLGIPDFEDAAAHRYLNRLSDLLFVLARAANDEGRSDVLWIPGGKR